MRVARNEWGNWKITYDFKDGIQQVCLKMLGLYPYSLIIGHKSCNVLIMLNKLPLQRELQNVVTNNVFFGQKVKTQPQQNKKSNIKTLAGDGN